MKELFEAGKVLSVVLDISLRHEGDGRRLIDNVKKNLTVFVKGCLEDDVDQFYLYYPDGEMAVSLHGEQNYIIGNYNTDGWRFNVLQAMKRALYVAAMEDLSVRKYILFVTDRIKSHEDIDKVIWLSYRDMIDACFIVVAIGENCNKAALDCLEGVAKVYRISSSSYFNSKLFKESDGE